MQIVRYSADRRPEWDHFVKASKNGTFLFLRGYMDYHADRFCDHSLMFYSDNGKLLALLPANERDGALHSHQGLTYGGFVLSPQVHITQVDELFDITQSYLRQHAFSVWQYKQVPTVYHRLPSQEDQYWLWRNSATMVECNMMTAIDLRATEQTISSRKHSYANRLQREGYSIPASTPLSDFWPVLESNLMLRFGSRPVHTLSEMEMLQLRFPANIVCRTVSSPYGQVVAGTVLYLTDNVVRTQYISASIEGKQTHALDLLFLTLVHEYRQLGYHYFDFGTSMAEDGCSLNEGLIQQKELLGGRSIACPVFALYP